MNDEMLIKEFINGNVSAFNTLVWRWEKPIFNFILQYLGDEDLAKDVMQKTFIRAYRNLNKLREINKFSSWLYRIATNQCMTALKREKKHMNLDDWNEAKDDRDPLFTPDENKDSAGGQNMNRILKHALQQVPQEQRIVIVLKTYHGLKFTEIADILSEPLNTIKSRMYYGVSSLQKIFKEWNITKEEFSYEL